MDVEFRVLGRVGVVVDGVDVPVRGRRERAVLALLLAARRGPVSIGQLISDVWSTPGDGSLSGSLHVAISQLRKVIEPGREKHEPPRILVTRNSGYLLLAPPGSVDAERFERLVEDAHLALGDQPRRALANCDEALALWTGAPFGDEVEATLTRLETYRLDALRTWALEVRAEAMMSLGQHAAAAADLDALIDAHPLHERFRELHARSLFLAGRRGDALAALRAARQVLAEELGADPPPALRELEASILREDPEPAPRPESHGLIGRERPLAALRAALASARAGRGRTALVTGDPGIGKTRLVAEVASEAEKLGVRVLWGRTHEASPSPAFWPWIPIIREIAGPEPDPLVADLLTAAGTADGADSDVTALRRFDAVSRLLAGTPAPLLVVLEDLQWADAPSLGLVAYLAETLPASSILLVATMRHVQDPTPALQGALAALARAGAVRVPLPGLTPPEVAGLLDLTLSGTALSGTADDDLVAVMADRTDGNPFFVLELVRLLASDGRLTAEATRQLQVPHGIQDVLRLRLAGLSAGQLDLLRTGAVIGREFDLAVVAEVARTTPDQAIEHLDALVRASLLEEIEPVGRYRFSHALVRETVAAQLTRAGRSRLHADVAVVLEPLLAADPESVADVARHFALGSAVRPDLAGRAVAHSVRAARQAGARGALGEALMLWEQALESVGRLPPERVDERYEVLVGVGRARQPNGDLPGSRQALGEAVEIARRLGRTDLIAEAAASFRGAGVWVWRDSGASDPAMIAVLEECVSLLEPGALQARALASLAVELLYQQRNAESERAGGRAVDLARGLDDTDLLADVVSMMTLVLWGRPGSAGDRVDLARSVLARPALSPERELYARFGAAVALQQQGDVRTAEDQIERCQALARRLRHTGADLALAWWEFQRAVSADDAPATELAAARTLDLHRRTGAVNLAQGRALIDLRLNGPGATVPDEVVDLARDHPNAGFRALVGHALAESGRVEDAIDLLGPPVPDGVWDYASTYSECLRIDVLAEAGPGAALDLALARVTPWAHEFASGGAIDALGSIHYFVGRAREAQGDLAGARTAYVEAIRANRRMEVVPWRRRAERRLAAL